MDIEAILREEIGELVAKLRTQVRDPQERFELARMVMDLSLLPLRAARGEDVTALAASLRAEALNRSLAQRLRAEASAREAWANVIFRLLGALTAT